jgi:CheY-like chemotaxis protein
MPVEQIAFNLRQVLAETFNLWRADAARGGLKLRCDGAHALPRMVSGDPTRLRQVINNLLSNAVKFTPSGSVTVHLAFTDSRLRLTVEDTGPGLGDGDPERLFRPFDQMEPGVARRHGGFGLGLAVSRKLARLMGGDLTAANRRAGGAAFSLVVPLAEARATQPRPEPLKVLVVDDHAINRETLKILLEPIGVAPMLAENGEAALAALEAQPFDLVLMDINMPGVDGRETTRRLRAAAGVNQRIPVIAVSGADTPREWKACAEAGMTSHVAKPIRPQRLYEAISAALTHDHDARSLEPALA